MRRTPLYEAHLAAHARMIEFAGWEMPVMYSSIIEEHFDVRTAAGMFDVSHMGDLILRGPTAKALLLRLLTNDVSDLPIWKGIYAHILNEEGKIIDDTIVYRLGEEEYLMVPNAATRDVVLRWIMTHNNGTEVIDISDDVACIAVQGPEAMSIMESALGTELVSVQRFHCRYINVPVRPREGSVWNGRILAARTGYTGEDGMELMMDASLALPVWDALLAHGKERGLNPAGLGARDTLRLEMGYLLSGTDFNGDQSTLQTGPTFVLKWDHEFIGREALLQEKQRDNLPRLCCIELLEKGVPRHGYPIELDGKQVGTITSGTMSPSLRKGIAMGYLPPHLTVPGQQLEVAIRELRMKAQVVRPPFYRKG